ncbi:MAG: Nif3-like dinuclear metal center hexameric protein [bacterium]
MHAHDPARLWRALGAIAPLALAEPWDNVGLLVEPPAPRPLRRVFLAIDLTEAVLDEALAAEADCVVAYHPPLFNSLKRLTLSDVKQRIVLRAVAAGLPLYSPHTALDAAVGGINDWLLEAFGPLAAVAPITPSATEPAAGAGRLAVLEAPRPLDDLLPAIKGLLGLRHLRVAAGAPRLIHRVAVCPGAGGSLFEGLRDVDLLLTGELRHHDVLAHVARGTSVVLTDHTHTERGYLPRLAARLQAATGLDVVVSQVDDDPLAIR